MNRYIRLFLGILVLGLLFSCASKRQQIIENTSEFQKYRNSIVRVENKHGFFSRGIGSGFFVERDKIATNIHVIAHPGPIYVKSVDKKTTWKVEGVAAYDVRNDLAILKVVGEGEALPLANSDTVQGGERISVVGYPDGKYKVTEGTLHRIRNTDKWLQMEVDTAGGSSGSPVLNSEGQVIGIDTTVDDFYSYAIPSNILKVLLTQSASTQPLEQWHKRELIRSYDHYVQGAKNYDKKRYDKAITDLDEAIRLNPESIYAYSTRGQAKSSLGDHKGAISDYDEAIQLNPEDFIAYYNRGYAKSSLGDPKGAISDYDKAIQLNPKYASAYNNRGVVKDNLGDPEGAISDYDKAIQLNPKYASAYNNRGVVKDNLGDPEGAISDYDKAIQLNLEYIDAYNNRGVAKLLLGISESKQENTKKVRDLLEAAIADFDKVIKIDSKYAIAYKNRGAAQLKLGESEADRGNVEKSQSLYQRSIADNTQCIRLNPAEDGAYGNRGIAKKLLGDSKSKQGNEKKAQGLYEAAIVDLDKAIQLNPRSTRSYRNRARVKDALGQHDAAKADFEKAQKLNSDIAK